MSDQRPYTTSHTWLPRSRLNTRNSPGACLHCNCQPLKKFRGSNKTATKNWGFFKKISGRGSNLVKDLVNLIYSFTLPVYLSEDCEIVIQLKVFLLYHACTNFTSNIATNISHFTIFFSVKKWIWHRSSHCCMQSPNFSNSFLHKEKASSKSLWNFLISNCWTMSKTIWTAILPA